MKNRSLLRQVKNRGGIFLLILVLLIQLLALIYTGTQKDGLHIDEHYSFILSNSFNADRIGNYPPVWNQWVSGDDFREFLTVEKGEQFAYGNVYKNNSTDAHPPLFYFLLHTVCSLFPGRWSAWMGMGMNFLLILLAQVALYCLTRKLTGSALWAVVPVAVYGGMQAFTDTAIFIRMYPLMTLLTVLLLSQHYHLLTREKKLSPILFCGALTFLGVFTHYYFAIPAFFMAAAGCFYLLASRKWKYLFAYAGAMLLGVILVFVIYPAGITQITGSETNNVGKEVAANILNFSRLDNSLRAMLKLLRTGILDGLRQHKTLAWTLTGITLGIAAVLGLLRCRKHSAGDPWKLPLIFTLLLTAVTALSFVAISHISSKFVNVRYLYSLFPLVALALSLALWLVASSLKLNKQVLAFGMIAIWLMGGLTVAWENRCTYLFRDRAVQDNILVQQFRDRPLVILNNGTTYQPTTLLHVLLESDQLYMADYRDMESMDSVLKQVDCTNGVLYIVLTDTYWSQGFDGDAVMTEITDQSHILSSYERFGYTTFSTVYVAYPNHE